MKGAAMGGAAAILLVVAGSASAQVGSGSLTWEASADGGGTWARDISVEPGARSVLVRCVAAWSDDGGMYAFAGAQFDAIVGTQGPRQDTASGFVRISNGVSSFQNIVATRFGEQLKIDDERDTLGPGMGNRGVFPGQLAQQWAGTNFTTANPVPIFTFELHLDGTPGDRSIFMRFPWGPMGMPEASMRIYTTPVGGQNLLRCEGSTEWNCQQLSVRNAVVRVVPGPGAAGVMAVGLIGLRRRVRA